ncbi:MAG: pyridoxamine 5'-phosphate oxidase family protein [Bacteroidetes bacterium]|nr:pyridoxamine 5'-phosphate oxidase family protein [Bacteroidota bacterium]
MRRKDRLIENLPEIEEIIKKSDVCRIAMVDGNLPYMVTMNFGYKAGNPACLFFHCANEGRKLDIIKKNNIVCFQMDIEHELITADKACGYTMNFKSIVGYGQIDIVDNREEKIEGLNLIMKQYTGKDAYDYNNNMLDKTTILKLEIDSISAKRKE